MSNASRLQFESHPTTASWPATPPVEAVTGVVIVHRAWNGWESAVVPVDALDGLRWSCPDGAPQPLLHGHVQADCLLAGALPHDCTGEPCRCRVEVCVLKAHAGPGQYDALARLAGTRPGS